MAMFNTPFGNYKLQLVHKTQHQQQPFNQADSYLLSQLHQLQPQAELGSVSIIGDQYGALAKALADFKPKLFHDAASYTQCLAVNGVNSEQAIYSLQQLDQFEHSYALLRLPKNLRLFHYQLALLSRSSDTVIVAGMQKYWPKAFYEAAYEYFDSVEVLPGIKKAKCMLLKQAKACKRESNDFNYQLEAKEFDLSLSNYPGVFSAEKLDIGSRFFLENMPNLSGAQHVLDLACGNGILGLYALKQSLQTSNNGAGIKTLSLVDDSALAIASAKDSLAAYLGSSETKPNLDFYHNDSLHGLNLAPLDAVLCNPPFHQQHSISDHTAKQMIKQSHEALKTGGSLYLIGNRHLGYGKVLRSQFNHVEVVAENDKFILYQARK